MDSVWTTIGGIVIALVSLAGTVYVAKNSRAAAKEQAAPQVAVSERQQDREAFREIREALQSQINVLREELGQIKQDVEKLRGERDDREAKLRSALSIVRTANQRLHACHCGQEPVSVPTELITWSI